MNMLQLQQKAVERLSRVLSEYNSAFLHTGVRTGQVGMVQMYVDGYGQRYKQIAVMHPQYLIFNDLTQCWNRRGADVRFNKMPDVALGKDALVIIPQCLWQPLGWATLLLAQERGHKVLGVSSNGSENWEGHEWLGMDPPQRLSYKTSDLNPEFDVEAHKKIFKGDIARFERDCINY